jgi:hypothetical protein
MCGAHGTFQDWSTRQGRTLCETTSVSWWSPLVHGLERVVVRIHVLREFVICSSLLFPLFFPLQVARVQAGLVMSWIFEFLDNKKIRVYLYRISSYHAPTTSQAARQPVDQHILI